MNNLNLIIELANKELIASTTNGTGVTLSLLYQGDLLNVMVTLANRYPSLTTEAHPGAAVSLYLTKADGTLLSLVTLAEVGGSASTQFSGQLALNTAAINTLLNSATSATVSLTCIIIDQGGERTTALQTTTTIYKDLSGTATAQTTPGIVYYTAAEVSAMFARLLGSNGQQITLVSPDGARRRSLGVDDDGNAVDNIT